MYSSSYCGEELSILDPLRIINMIWQCLHKCCLLSSCFLCYDLNEKYVESIMNYDVVIYSNSIAFPLWFTDVSMISYDSVAFLIMDGLSCFILLR